VPPIQPLFEKSTAVNSWLEECNEAVLLARKVVHTTQSPQQSNVTEPPLTWTTEPDEIDPTCDETGEGN
jgi:hypothetical protein